MALAVTLKASGSVGSTSAATRSQALTAITFAADSIVMVVLGGTQENYAAGWLSATATGLTFTERVTAEATGQFNAASRILTAPHSAGGSTVITVTTGATQCYTLSYAVYEITGHDTGTTYGATATYGPSATPTDGSHSMTLSAAPASGSVVVSSLYIDTDTNHGGITEGSGWTEDADVYSATWYGDQQTQQRTGSTSTSVAWADIKLGASGVYNVSSVALEIIAGAGGGTGATVTPATVAAVAAVPAPTVSTAQNATATPSAVPAPAAVPPPTVAAGTSATAAPGVVAATVGIIDAPVSISAHVEVEATQATTTAPTPSVSVGSNATVSPSVIQVAGAVGAPSVLAGQSASISPAVTTALSAVGEVTVTGSASSTVAPGAVSASAAVQAPAVTAGVSVEVSPASITAVSQVPAPAASASSDALISPSATQALAAVPSPSVQAVRNVAITASTVASVVSVPTPPFIGEVVTIVSPGSVAVVASVPMPSVSSAEVFLRYLGILRKGHLVAAWLHYYAPRYTSAILRNGVWQEADGLDDDEIMNLTEGVDYFVGGRMYDITPAMHAELESAGLT